MTVIKTPPGSVRAARGFFNVSLECLVISIKALSDVPPFFLKISQFSLRFSAVTMTADRFNIIHATIANSRFNRIFASFLITPDQTGTTTRHDTRHAIICSNQAQIGLILAQQTIVFFLWVARHYIIDPGDLRLVAGWLPRHPPIQWIWKRTFHLLNFTTVEEFVLTEKTQDWRVNVTDLSTRQYLYRHV